MHTSPLFFATLFTLLSTFAFAFEAAPLPRGFDAHVRRQEAPAVVTNEQGIPQQEVNTNDPLCISYRETADMGIVANISTWRTAFMQLSRTGTNANRVMLNKALADLKIQCLDQGLNTRCGNLTELRIPVLNNTFVNESTVLGLKGVETLDQPAGKIVGSDMSLLFILAAMLIVMMGTWSFL